VRAQHPLLLLERTNHVDQVLRREVDLAAAACELADLGHPGRPASARPCYYSELSYMPDSLTASTSRPPKRQRLVESARELIYAQGVQRTTLAQIAERADVPAGNVYYYYKTRDDLVHAVIESRLDSIRALLSELDRRSTPKARLKALAGSWEDAAPRVKEHGCPIGSLACELSKDDNALAADGARMIRELLDWIERQFRELKRRDAPALAVALLASIQGAALISSTLHDEELFHREIRRIRRWIDDIA
jgi:TetR/AcrR family transcriptional repressor of nem operon